jgi:hypothetical protein
MARPQNKRGPVSPRPTITAIAIWPDFMSSFFVFEFFFTFLPPNYISASSFPYFIRLFCVLFHIFGPSFSIPFLQSSLIPFLYLHFSVNLFMFLSTSLFLQVYQTTEPKKHCQVNGSMKQSSHWQANNSSSTQGILFSYRIRVFTTVFKKPASSSYLKPH